MKRFQFSSTVLCKKLNIDEVTRDFPSSSHVYFDSPLESKVGLNDVKNNKI